MKKLLLSGAVLLLLLLCGCQEKPDERAPGLEIPEKEEEIEKEDSGEPRQGRAVSFEIDPDVREMLKMGNTAVAAVDELYLLTKAAFESQEDEKLTESIYDTVIRLQEREQRVIEKQLEVETPGFLDWWNNSYFDQILRYEPILAVGLEQTQGAIDQETAARKMIQAADELLDFYYEDYVPVDQTENQETGMETQTGGCELEGADGQSTQEQVRSDFIRAYYGWEADVELENLGVIGDQYCLPSFGVPDWFSLFRITDSTGEQATFAMQVSDPQIPEVYLVTEEGQLELVWNAPIETYYDFDSMYEGME